MAHCPRAFGKRVGAAAPKPVDRVADAYAELARSPGSWVGIINLRKKLSGLSRPEQDAALKELSRSGRAVIAPESNRKVLTADDHAASIRIGGDDNHLIMMR